MKRVHPAGFEPATLGSEDCFDRGVSAFLDNDLRQNEKRLAAPQQHFVDDSRQFTTASDISHSSHSSKIVATCNDDYQNLARVIATWPRLSALIQKQILTLTDLNGSLCSEQVGSPNVQFAKVHEQPFDEQLADRLRRAVLAALRHTPERLGLRMDAEGWVDLLEVGNVLNSISAQSLLSDRASVQNVLRRLGFADRLQFAHDYCRAAYGHSTRWFEPKIEATPDECLYHGTSVEAFRLIDCFGLQPCRRRFVQLTTDFEYARRIAEQISDNSIVLQVSKAAALESNVKFYPSGTHVWQATPIPPECLHVWRTGASDLDD